MLTLLGKELRILRFNRGELLKNMADKLHITPAYLSAIENGKREPTKKFMDSLFMEYDLTEQEVERIKKAYFETVNSVTIDISLQTQEKRDLSLVFARRFDSLSEDEVESIRKILDKTKEM